MTSDLAVSIARTAASKVVGGIAGWALAVDVVVPTDLSTSATLALTGAIVLMAQMVYYVLARLLERRWPLVGAVLLWAARQPTYDPPPGRSLR